MTINHIIQHIIDLLSVNAPVIICCSFGGMVRMLRNHSKSGRELRIMDSIIMLLTSVFVGATCYPQLQKYVSDGESSTILLMLGYCSQDIIDRSMAIFANKINKLNGDKEDKEDQPKDSQEKVIK